MQNLNDLVADLANLFEDLKHDRVELQKAKGMCDVAGKLIGVVNAQLQIITLGATETTPFMRGRTEQLRQLKPGSPPAIKLLKNKLKKSA